MSYPTDRIMLFDRCDSPIGDLSVAEPGFRCVCVLELNGEHSLTITTHTIIEEGTRALTVDGMGVWSEWVCETPDELHASGRCATGTYRFIWSLQYDLQSVFGAELRPGIPNPVGAAVALADALDGTSRWTVGTVDVTTTGSLSMYDNSAWDRLRGVVAVWHGEVDAHITVGPDGVVSRCVDLRAHLGTTSVTRRFDWSRDLKSVRRTPAPGPRFCRVIPRGKGEQVESSTGGEAWTRRINIKSVNDDVEYLRDEDAELAFRVPDGSGGYEYPRKIVIYEDIEDPQELYDTALADLHNHTRPAVTYEAEVQQLARAGMDVQGIALGDDVQVVDKEFAEGVDLRIQGRVLRLTYDWVTKELQVTLGRLAPTIADTITRLEGSMRQTSTLAQVLEAGGTAAYLQNLIGRLNGEINATGGYSYIVPGLGFRTYDVAVSDPAVGNEASKVVEVRGGSIRIANTRTSDGDWDWHTVFTSGHIASDMVTTAHLTAGYIRSADNNVFIDLDNGTMRLSPGSAYGDTTLEDALNDAKRYATDYLTYENGELTLGLAESVIRSVLTNSQLVFRTNENEDVAWFGLNAKQIWEMFIETATIRNRLSFGDFSWIARENGNMTLKWMGE